MNKLLFFFRKFFRGRKVKKLEDRRLLRKRVYCVDCVFAVYDRIRKAKAIQVYIEKEDRVSTVLQENSQWGCTFDAEHRIDYVSGDVTLIMKKCFDANKAGECPNHKKKPWAFFWR